MNCPEYIARIFRTRYTRALEAEVARLRAENRGLLNSILSIAGLPPLRLEAEITREHHREQIAAKADFRARHGHNHSASSNFAQTARAGPGCTPNTPGPYDDAAPRTGQGIVLPVNPQRRRSWQQINRILEIEESRQVHNRDNSDSMRRSDPA